MTNRDSIRGGTSVSAPENSNHHQRYVAWFHELDAWTEYWDIYHPETRGRFYFGDGKTETGLLTRFLPRTNYPPAWIAWTRMALETDSRPAFVDEIRKPEVASAVIEVDALVARVFRKHFGEASDSQVQTDYLDGILRFAIDALPPATERDARIPEGDWRKPTAGRHTLDGDLMWFAWAMQIEAAEAICQFDNSYVTASAESDHARRALLIAGVVTGCPANFAWRGHRRTRTEYQPNEETIRLLHDRGMHFAVNFESAADEAHALYRIREWGEEG
jgi:hypothetical protein